MGTLPANQFGTGRDAAVRFRATTAGCKTAAVTFTLHVDGPAWRQHTESVRDSLRAAIRGDVGLARLGDLVPVAKGNGYGLGLQRLAQEATRLGVDRLAVGTVFEVPEVEVEWARAAVPRLMAGVGQLKVPLLAEVGVGRNWDEAH